MRRLGTILIAILATAAIPAAAEASTTWDSATRQPAVTAASSDANSYVTNLTVLDGVVQPTPDGWTKLNEDLNAGAGGDYLYFAYDTATGREPITRIYFVDGQDAKCANDYVKIDLDLNRGAGGKYIYTCFTRSQSYGVPITDLRVVLSKTSNPPVPSPWIKIDTDLNGGAGGDYVFLEYRNV
jgi:hypothetical protein